MLFRILSVRKHKNVTFYDTFDNNFNKIQLMIHNDNLDSNDINIGSVINADVSEELNNRGVSILKVQKIYNVKNYDNNLSYKSLNQENMIKDYKKQNFINALNGGINLKHWQLKNRLVQDIEQYLIKNNYIRITTSNYMEYRGTSTVSPIKSRGRYVDDMYLKITHELNLKKMCYLTLNPLFEIGYLSRDVYNNQHGMFESYNLEAVSPNLSEEQILNLYVFIIKDSVKLAEEMGLEFNQNIKNICVIDVLEEYFKYNKKFEQKNYLIFFKKLLLDNKDAIFVNAPINTPFAKVSEYGIPLETKWKIDTKTIGHGYKDESDLSVIENSFQLQKRELEQKGIDAVVDTSYLDVLKYSGIDTLSLNFAIDRYLQKFFEYEHIGKVYKLLGV